MSRLSISIGGEISDKPRSALEIARRALALGAVVARSFDAPRGELHDFISRHGLSGELTVAEHTYLYCARRTRDSTIRMTWNSERLMVLLWSIHKIEAIPGPSAQCSTAALADALPPFGIPSFDEFIQALRRRSERALFDKALEIQEQHAVAIARRRDKHYRPSIGPVDIEVVQERHRAINWVVGYCGLGWDEVTADT